MLRGGMALIAFASCWFSASNLLVKLLGSGVPVHWVALARNLVALPLLLGALAWEGLGLRSRRPVPLLLRGLFGSLAMLCMFWALPRAPMGALVMLSCSARLFTAVWGVLFLGEELDRRALGAVALAFAGVYLTLRPSFAGGELGPYLAALASGLFSSLAFATIKSVGKDEPSLRIIFYFGLVGAAFFLPGALASGYVPSARDWPLLAGVGFSSTAAQLFLTAGIRRAPVSRAGVGTFFLIVANILAGWLFLDERPDAWTWAGCALISAGLLGLAAPRQKAIPAPA